MVVSDLQRSHGRRPTLLVCRDLDRLCAGSITGAYRALIELLRFARQGVITLLEM